MAAVCREARLLLQSISVGAVLMMVYDLIRLFRSLVPHQESGGRTGGFLLLDLGRLFHLFVSVP